MRTSIISSLAVLGLCLDVVPAECQTTAPSAAVFGGSQTRDGQGDGLGLSLSAYEAYDDDVLAGTTGSGTPSQPSIASRQSGLYSGLAVGLLYARSGDTSNIRSWANSAIAYYPDQSNLSAVYHQLGLAFSAPLGSRVRVSGSPFADYRPYYSLRLLPVSAVPEPEPALAISEGGPAPSPEIDYTRIQRNSYRYGGNFGLGVSVTNRLGLGINYGHVQTAADEGLVDTRVRGGGAGLTYRLTRNAALRASYSRYESSYEVLDRRPTETQNITIGINYNKPLSITRRTHLEFGTGSAIADDAGGNRRFQALGSALLRHQMGRTWSARTDYRREFGYLEGFAQPVLSDSVGGGFGGLMSPRVEFSSDARYFNGAVGLTPNAPRFDTYSAWVRVRTGLNRSLAAYAEYFFYHYEFADAAARPTGLPPRYSRNGVRVGLTLWVPLVKN